MKPIEFKEQNVVLAENQEEYSPLPSYLDDGPEGYVISCWSLSVRERFSLLLGGCIWISQMSFHRPAQPLYVTTDKGDLFILSLQRGSKGAG